MKYDRDTNKFSYFYQGRWIEYNSKHSVELNRLHVNIEPHNFENGGVYKFFFNF